ncbi:hypothetical protein [Parafrankia sp. BMG5.11]|uniref:hypothetical protein n=1 Tax=Parafrankia sp. BMG5.11 TaxID=222540 RepID=UPI00104087C4|nr:hypothetical protein [Parafrankia sp. BMG5.11]TCJ35203.1 hypothetical protein E0504_29380 [Parafrankia sp. BMG5.11]
MARGGSRPGEIAKSLIYGIGDVDVGLAGPEARRETLDALEQQELETAHAAGIEVTRKPRQKIKRIQRALEMAHERRKGKSARSSSRVDQAARWRQVGIQERIPLIHLSLPLRVVILLLLATVDFYVFAQAYAYLTDVEDFSPEWWVGGGVGTIVFLTGLVLAHEIKALVLGRAQRKLLQEIDDGSIKIEDDCRERLVCTESSPIMLGLALFGFTVLFVFGLLVRLVGSDENWSISLLLSLVPVVVVVVEAFIHDPMDRAEPRRSLLEWLLERKLAKESENLAVLQEKIDRAISRIKHKYVVERSILATEQADMGLGLQAAAESRVGPVDHSRDPDPTLGASSNGHIHLPEQGSVGGNGGL